MIEILKNFLEKSFWPLVGCYCLYILYKIYSYFTGLKYMVNKGLYDQWFLEKMLSVSLILGIAFILKLWGKTRIASLILGVPATITVVTTLIIVAVWLFLAIAFILFGKS
jgi:hypothetical protein